MSKLLKFKKKEKENDGKEVLVPSTFNKMLNKANEIKTVSFDFNVKDASMKNIRFNEQMMVDFVPIEDNDIHSCKISRYALGQMGSKIGVPVQYIEKCLKSGREVLARDNMNSWLSDYHKDLFIRCYKDKIRSVLSSKYSVCDSHEILEVLKDVVDLSKYTVKGSFINEERLHLRLIGNEKLPINGEDLFAGIFLDSSDVGRSILKVNFGIYKQVCTNGLIISRAGGTLFKQKHIGISSEDFYEGLYESMSNVDILVENAVSFVEMASNTSSGYDVASLSKEEMEEFAEEIRNKTKLSQEGAEKVINLMQYKYDSSKWGLINGITEVAQDYTLERRLELETIAGNLLTA